MAKQKVSDGVGFITLTEGMRALSQTAHDASVLTEIVRGHYESELTEAENEMLKRFAPLLEEIRDGTANVAKAYTRLTRTDY